MRAVVHVPDSELADRRAKGLDHWDEMWEGVLHMTPAPNLEHQRVLGRLIEFLGPRLRERGRGALFPGINVFRESTRQPDYRIPDLTFVSAGREHLLTVDGVRVEGPDAVLEIRSPEDETYEKLPFFAALGVREVIVVHRDTKNAEVFRLSGSRYVAVEANEQGWIASEALSVQIRRVDAQPPRLAIEDLHEAASVQI
jgi:Uma2 family endonuclease